MLQKTDIRPIEWQTLLILFLCYCVWMGATTWLAGMWRPLGFAATTLAVALHSSLSHEVLHGHPFRIKVLNEALVFPAIGVFMPYGRFRIRYGGISRFGLTFAKVALFRWFGRPAVIGKEYAPELSR